MEDIIRYKYIKHNRLFLYGDIFIKLEIYKEPVRLFSYIGRKNFRAVTDIDGTPGPYNSDDCYSLNANIYLGDTLIGSHTTDEGFCIDKLQLKKVVKKTPYCRFDSIPINSLLYRDYRNDFIYKINKSDIITVHRPDCILDSSLFKMANCRYFRLSFDFFTGEGYIGRC